jgi:F-type H+-transporting ATPase subunit delta
LSDLSVARQYANALFTVAERAGSQAAANESLRRFAELVAEHPELQAIFETPIVTPRKKRALVEALVAASGDVSVEVRRLFTLLADRDRLMLLPVIARAYADRVMEADRSVAADVVTAMPLPDDRRRAIEDALGRATGKSVSVTSRVDPDILGGLVARVGSLVFDGSVAGQLARMRQRVSAGS